MEIQDFIKEFGKLPDDQFCTQEHLSAILMIPPSTLEKARLNGGFIPFVKFGKAVRYKVGDIRSYIAKNTFDNTAQMPTLATLFDITVPFTFSVALGEQLFEQDALGFCENLEKDFDNIDVLVDNFNEKQEAIKTVLHKHIVEELKEIIFKI